ncbi:MAG TPA: hypothetical protein PK107_01080 [Candidatus Omnitrophota bacterium]|nr:hypothetical protein [Candidatus Omnitrophota bacterium]
MRPMTTACLILLLAAGYVYAVESGSIPATQQPVILEKTGTGAIFLEAAIYPEFTGLAPSAADPWCTPENPRVFDYLTDKDIRTKSNSPNLKDGWPNHENPRIRLLLGTNPKSVVTTEPWPDGRDLDTTKLGVQPTDLVIKLGAGALNPKYSETAKILVTWTMRIEGECPKWHIGHFICEPYNGSVSFLCKKENVETWVRVKYDLLDENGKFIKTVEKDLKPRVMIEMPETQTKTTQSDPTLTGTYVITAQDFPDNGNRIPAGLTLRVYWEHKGAMYIYSPDGMRNMIVNVIPYTKAAQ